MDRPGPEGQRDSPGGPVETCDYSWPPRSNATAPTGYVMTTTMTMYQFIQNVIHCVHEKTVNLDNVRWKCKNLNTSNCVLDYEYICDRNAKFHKKILFITRVINIQILTTKYFSFQYSVTYCSQALRLPAHRAREIVHLLTHETPDFITPAL